MQQTVVFYGLAARNTLTKLRRRGRLDYYGLAACNTLNNTKGRAAWDFMEGVAWSIRGWSVIETEGCGNWCHSPR